MAYRIAVDTGGTFCDFVLHDESTGEVHIAKVSSTPDDPSRAIVEGVRKVLRERQLDARDVHFFSHGTTVGTNA
ncbi:MAG: hydantoinase/oxoprolinase family protein, partial [Alicyclobacillus sp.]|nr:hydantoinase/oxoprolinase family protein [Alicyclobacillus sp.]